MSVNTISELVKAIDEVGVRPEMQHLYETTGLNDPAWRDILCKNAVYSHLTAFTVPLRPEMVATTVLPASTNYDNSRLVLAQNGPPVVSLPRVEEMRWPYSPVMEVTIVSPTEMHAVFAGHTWIVPCTITEGTIFPVWPDTTGVRGNIDLTGIDANPGRVFRFLTPAVYPAEVVAERLADDPLFFGTMVETEYVSEVYHAIENSEALAIVVAALYKSRKQ